jgi:transcriptional regulator
MYVPASFQEADRAIALDLVEAHGFATLVSWSGSEPLVSHVPLLLDRAAAGGERLLGHVARANPHWRSFDGQQPALAIFHGPHAYVSPAWYANHPSVPTWSYVVVHAHGTPALVDEDATAAILDRLIDKYERKRGAPWTPALPPDFLAKNLRAIVGFQIPIARLEAKFKLGQNKDEADRAGALAGLEGEAGEAERELARFMRGYFARKRGG